MRHVVAIDGAEHAARTRFVHLAAAEGDQLVEQRQRITHAAVGGLRHEADAAGLGRNLFGLEHLAEVFADQRHRQALEIELQAARQHGDRQLLRIGGRQQELHVRGRFLERLQQRVERVRRQHVHFVDEVDLVAAARGRVLHVLEQLARVVDLGARRGVDFDEVDEAALVDFLARGAHAARRGGDAGLAVEALGEDARDGGLADAARTREQERVMHAPLGQCITQRDPNVFLADEFGEGSRPPFARQREVAH
jgi:hypothetical protein